MSNFDAITGKLVAINDDVLVAYMEFGEIKTTSGIILRSDDGKAHGIKPRWAQVYAIGPSQKDVKVGEWILIEHGRWTRKVKVNDGEREIEIQKVDVDSILAVSDECPSQEYIGQE